MFNKRSVMFWPVGTGDSTTFVVRENEVIFQVDLRHKAESEDEDTDCAPIIDRLEEHLPRVDGKPYLSVFALTHPDEDHVLGFSDLLDRVMIGELWFTPRIFREHDDDKDAMCKDAQAFREEAHRRVTATITAGGDPGAGNRVRLIGYDTLLEDERYENFPAEFFSVPGNAITKLDGQDLMGEIQVFLHGPFRKDDIVGDRNDTSLVMQVALSDDPANGGVLLFGDHKYPTIRKIIDISKDRGNEERLKWQLLLAPHHCSKSVMYQLEDGKEKLKQDILVDLEALQVADGVIVASSISIPASNQSGDNPPHAKAKARYEEIAAGGFLCTHDDGSPAEPLIFRLEDSQFVYEAREEDLQTTEEASKSALRIGVQAARGSDETPSEKVGFGAWD